MTVTSENAMQRTGIVGQRCKQHRQIGKRYAREELPTGQLVDDERQRIITAAGAALPHDQPDADADKRAA